MSVAPACMRFRGGRIYPLHTRHHDDGGNRDQEERFFYDNRNRLTRTDSRVNGGSWVTNRQVQTYNVAGNILTKTGLGTYTYGSTRPHAVTSAGGVTYSYDANGNVVSDTSGRAFHYTTYDLVRRVSQGTAHTEFHYGAGREKTLKRAGVYRPRTCGYRRDHPYERADLRIERVLCCQSPYSPTRCNA